MDAKKNENQIYIRACRAHEIFDVSKTTFWRFTKEESFPKKRRVLGTVCYSIEELTSWFDSCAESA